MPVIPIARRGAALVRISPPSKLSSNDYLGRNVRKQAAPGNGLSIRSSAVRVLANRKPWVNASRWVIPGSRPLRYSLAGRSAEMNTRGFLIRVKAAPLRGDRRSRIASGRKRFEDENEYEDGGYRKRCAT